ncbi:MAG: hypothetical protein PVG22_15185 [Chromatiales bacterium]|jgi:hypothetical protein
MYKQGIVRQAGAADVLARRMVVDLDAFDPTVDNPFAYENLDCDSWQFTDGSNPRYVKGLCMSSSQNMSGSTIVECTDGVDNCTVHDVPWDELFTDLDKTLIPGSLPKTTEWRQCADGVTFNAVSSSGDVTNFTCEDDDIDDQTWENPYDLAKGHRGFMKGDMIVVL